MTPVVFSVALLILGAVLAVSGIFNIAFYFYIKRLLKSNSLLQWAFLQLWDYIKQLAQRYPEIPELQQVGAYTEKYSDVLNNLSSPGKKEDLN